MQGEAFGLRLARSVRPRCSECGSSRVAHGLVSELAGEASPDQRRSFAEGLGFVDLPDAFAWLCREPGCQGLGVFGPLEFGP